MGIISSVSESAQLAASINDNNEGCYFVPAFAGLALLVGSACPRYRVRSDRRSSRATIVRAACESMAYQSYDVLRAMEQDGAFDRAPVCRWRCLAQRVHHAISGRPAGYPVLAMRDGGDHGNRCRVLGDILPSAIGKTWKSWSKMPEIVQDLPFPFYMSAERREQNLAGWRDAVKRSLSTAQ